MLQDQYEKHNLEMQPYRHYLAEYQNMRPEEIGRHLEIPFDKSTRLFHVKFMEKNYTVSYPELAIHCLDEPDEYAVLCNDIHAKILILRYFTEGDYVKATGNLLSYRDLPWGEVYYRQFYGRCVMRLARMFGKRPEAFKKVMESMKGVPREYGDAAYEFQFLEGLRLCFVLWVGDEEFPPSAQILFSDNFPAAYAAEDVAYIGDVVLDYMKRECSHMVVTISVLFFAVVMVCIFASAATVVTFAFGSAIAAIPGGIIYMLMRAKVPKAGSVLLSGVVIGLIEFLIGAGWAVAVGFIAGAVIAELLARAGHYKSFWLNTIGYSVYMTFFALGTYLPMVIMTGYVDDMSTSNGVSAEYLTELHSFMNGTMVVIIAVVTFVAGIV
ncbi:MAG TPA: MptD family putative ECF transporter S component, partial [Candidatus Choladousia intestinavium]|nr:MptD family putative ECF transporter S component [Candidatus Choladousia intestinavium]